MQKRIDVLVAILASLFLFFAMFIGKKHVIGKMEGISFVIIYVAYIAFLIIRG